MIWGITEGDSSNPDLSEDTTFGILISHLGTWTWYSPFNQPEGSESALCADQHLFQAVI